MKFALPDRLLRRDLGEPSRYSSYRGIYSDRGWVDDLDIVNELGGHSGCVNALRYALISIKAGWLMSVPQLVFFGTSSCVW